MALDTLTAEQAEAVEAEIMYRYVASATPSTAAELGIATARMGGGVALSVRNDMTRYWSKALGFGFAEPVSEGLIDRVVDFYRAERSRGFTIQIAPQVLPSNWSQICDRHGFESGGQVYKMACAADEVRVNPAAAAGAHVRVGEVGPGDIDTWARAALDGFGMPPEGLLDMISASASAPDTRQFAAWIDGEIVATGALLIRGDVGALNGGATLPAHRNQGLQTALIAARVDAAIRAGCRWITAGADKPAEGVGNPSLNNLRRAGLRPLYLVRDWVWTP